MTHGDFGEAAYLELLARLEADPTVLGAVLTGSRGRGAFVRDDSDWDVRIFADEAPGARERYATPHGSVVEAVVLPLRALENLTDPTSAAAWDRYSYVHATVVVDRTGGSFAASIARMEILPAESARSIASTSLDDYINSYYRSLKNARAGLVVEAHLDASESLSPLLTTLFAIHRRVRPFNKFLGWELETHPLPGDRMDRRSAAREAYDAPRDGSALGPGGALPRCRVAGSGGRARRRHRFVGARCAVAAVRGGRRLTISRAGRVGGPGTRGSRAWSRPRPGDRRGPRPAPRRHPISSANASSSDADASTSGSGGSMTSPTVRSTTLGSRKARSSRPSLADRPDETDDRVALGVLGHRQLADAVASGGSRWPPPTRCGRPRDDDRRHVRGVVPVGEQFVDPGRGAGRGEEPVHAHPLVVVDLREVAPAAVGEQHDDDGVLRGRASRPARGRSRARRPSRSRTSRPTGSPPRG